MTDFAANRIYTDTMLDSGSRPMMHADMRAKQRLSLVALLELHRVKAEPVEGWKVSTQAQRIQYRQFPAAPPMGESTIRTRLNELCGMGLVERIDRNGLTQSHNRCVRYRLTPAGIDVAKEISHVYRYA